MPLRAGAAHRQAGRGGRLGAGRHGLRAAAGARRARRHAVREGRPHRRAAALRHPRLQDGEMADRPPRRADGGRGGRIPHRRRSRRRCSGRRSAGAIRCRGDDRRRRIAARSRSARPRPRRHPFRDGVPAAAEQARRRRRRGEGGAERHDQRRRQACHRDRRRRHRLGLHRHLEPAGRAVDHAARNPAQAAGAREQGAGLAGLAA